MQTIKPADNQIFARPSEEEKQTKSGFLLADSAIERPKTAEVINVGQSVKGYEAYDIVVYKQYAATPLKLNGEEFIMIEQSDVLGTVLEEE